MTEKNNDPCLNGVSIVFWNGCDVKTFDIWAFTKKAKQPLFTYRIPWVHIIINYCVDKLYLFTFDKSVLCYSFPSPFHYYLSSKCFFLFRLVYFLKWISNSNHWPLFIFLWYHLISLCYMSDHYAWFNVACTHMFTDDTTYTMVYCISLCQT
jgi:hypothetical protein